MAELDLELVRHALSAARRNGYAEVELSVGDDKFAAKLVQTKSSSRPKSQAATEPAEPELTPIKATMVGFYRVGKKPLEVGQVIEKGQVVANIATLGILNDLESKVAGEVVEVLIQPDEPVQFGQIIALVRPV